MTLRQNFNKTVYHLLKMASRWIKMRGHRSLNRKNIKPATPIYALFGHSNQGEAICFDTYKGNYILIANTASHCGYTAQYAEMQQLQDRFKEKLKVIAFPANDFGGQEPGPDDEIAHFCAINFGVRFPVMMKSEVVGTTKNEIFEWLTNPSKNGWNSKQPTWNFCKYLVSPTGTLLGFFESGISPLDDEIAGRIH